MERDNNIDNNNLKCINKQIYILYYRDSAAKGSIGGYRKPVARL